MDNATTPELASAGIFSSTPVLQICLSIVNLCFVLLMVTVSQNIDTKDMSRLYTLWLFLAHAPSEVIQIVISILQLQGLVDSSGNYYRYEIDVIQVSGKVFVDITNQVYRILALLLVSATFMSYKFPFAFHKLFHASKRNRLYIYGFIFITVQSVLSNLYTVAVVGIRATKEVVPAAILDAAYYLIQFLQITPMVLLALMHVLSIRAILQYNQERALRGAATARHQRQLLSVIIYATIPNLLLFPTLLVGISNIILSTMSNEEKRPGNPMVEFSSVINTVNRYCGYTRLPIITISTFVAFAVYRNLFLRFSFGQKFVTKVQTLTEFAPKA